MADLKHWTLLRTGKTEEALSLLRKAYPADPSPSHVMRLGVAYLWVGDYHAAWKHFLHAIQTAHHPGAGFYGMAGVAKWCIDEPGAAVQHWQAGLGAQYADGAGGIHVPLLLFVASILRPRVLARKKAEEILVTKVKDPRVKNWPGPLARFVLEEVDESTLKELAAWRGSLPPQRRWLLRFYKGINELCRDKVDPTRFGELTRRLADTSQPEWSEQIDFLHLLWNEEFFIARHEASLTQSFSLSS